jgi:hypothetical protein
MASLIRLKQIESGSSLSQAASVGSDFSASVYEIIDGAGLISSSAQVILQQTTGQLSGSKIVGDIQATSVDYTNVLNKPTLVSGSSQIDATSTTNWTTGIKSQLNSNTVVSGSTQVVGILSSLNQFTASLDNTFATDAELAVTTSNLSIDMGEF